MRTNAAPTGPGRTLAAVLRALASLAVLAAAIAGLPLLLVKVTPVVWETSHDDLSHLLDRQDTGGAFLLVLVAVAWLGWAQFTFCTLREIPAQLRGREWRAPRGLGSSQRLAAVLVGSILVLLPTSTALASPANAVPPVAASHQAQQAPQTPQPMPAARAATTVDDGAPTYTVRDVRPAESLWSIAEKELGDGERWRDIAQLNNGRTMVDGSAFHASTFLQPGWQLRMPETTAEHANTPAPQQEARSVTVTPGGTMWGIAEKELGDGAEYPRIFEENRNAPQSDGATLTDPDELRAGWKLTIPQPAAPTEPDKPSDTAKPDAKAPGGSNDEADPEQGPGAADSSRPDQDREKPDTAQPPKDDRDQGSDREEHVPPAAPKPSAKPKEPAASPSAPTAKPANPSPSQPSQPSVPEREPAASADSDESEVGVREVAGIGLLLAGCLLAALGVKRLLQRRRRKPGETIAMPAEGVRLEQVLEASAEPGSVDLLDRALRTLGHHAARQNLDLPAVRGARVTARTVELLLDTEAAEPLAPFTAAADGRWKLDETHPLLTSTEAHDTPAPYPGLVTLGTEPDGSQMLLNLPAVRCLLLDGDDEDVRDTARVIALEAATSAWCDHAEILTVGLGSELPALLPQGRMRVVPHLRAAQSELGELLLDYHQQTQDDEQPDPLPWLLICAAEATPHDAQHLADALATARDLPVALVLPAKGARGAFPDAECLTAGAEAPQRLDALDSDVIARGSLTQEEYREFLEVLHTAEEPARAAEGSWQLVPPGPLDARDSSSGRSPAGAFAGLTVVPQAPFTALSAAADATTSPSSVQVFTPGAPQENPADAAGTLPATPRNLATPTAEGTEPDTEDPTDLDPDAPEIQILGPVTVTGIQASGHGFKLALLAALLHFKPDGCTIDTAREAMDPRSPWSKQTLQVRISELRNRLGADADGNLYLPKGRTGTYRLSPKVRSDWDRFQQLAKRGLAKGPTTGIADLETALGLVRGRPFDGADLTWAAARIQEILVRVTDVAHTLATWHSTAPRPDLDAARRAVRIGLDIDDSAELLYQDWMLIEDKAANHRGVRTAYETLRGVNQRLDVGMEPETEQVYDEIMSSRSA
ncbi:hypothetical protein ACFQ7F_34745 [Streptomyces sp. NPDC056486]|uniref:hypothetical protein n=1 Tax=Streptomyces sp. NPDC056486 TaxID=3345835 RepID=UPI0036C5798E